MNKRLHSIDFIRGIAILAMIQTHLWQVFINDPKFSKGIIFNWFVVPWGGYAAPLFTLISGLSTGLSIQSIYRRDNDSNIIIKRGIILFIFSSIINVSTNNILHIQNIPWLNWSIFQLIGICLILTPFFTKLNIMGKSIWTLIPIILPECIPSIKSNLPFLYNGFAPFFPWMSLFFAGFIISKWYIIILNRNITTYFLKSLLFGLFLLVPLKYILEKNCCPFNNWDRNFGINITSMTVYVGLFICLLVFIGYIIEFHEYKNHIINMLIGLGKYSLTIYYIQLISIIGFGIAFRNITKSNINLNILFFFPMLLFSTYLLHLIINIIWSRINHTFTIEWFIKHIVTKRWVSFNKTRFIRSTNQL